MNFRHATAEDMIHEKGQMHVSAAPPPDPDPDPDPAPDSGIEGSVPPSPEPEPPSCSCCPTVVRSSWASSTSWRRPPSPPHIVCTRSECKPTGSGPPRSPRSHSIGAAGCSPARGSPSGTPSVTAFSRPNACSTDASGQCSCSCVAAPRFPLSRGSRRARLRTNTAGG